MARRARPWYRKARQAWFVTVNGEQHNLGPEKAEAYERFYQLMRQPKTRKVSPHSLTAIADAFLDWVQQHRSPDTFKWYRYRLERFCARHPDLRVAELRPFHVQQWVDSYPLSRTSKRNYVRSVKRCLKWAVEQGYVDANPIQALEFPPRSSPQSTDSTGIAGHPTYSLYTLRHSWATRALRSGLDGLTVAILRGHSDPSTLARVYQHVAHQPEHLLEQA